MDVKETKGTSLNISIIQSDKKKTYERTTWTFFSFIGDVGGFNGAIGIFPTLIMSYYSSRMYQASVFNDVPVTSKSKSKKRSPSALAMKLAKAPYSTEQRLEKEDIEELVSEAKTFK